tara:strand:- start:1446 stop:2159 length:714 start_codon:yes stop_codon:yes gene_type:complete
MIKLKDLLTEAPKIKKVKNLSVQYMDAEFVGDVDFRPVSKAWVYKKDKPKNSYFLVVITKTKNKYEIDLGKHKNSESAKKFASGYLKRKFKPMESIEESVSGDILRQSAPGGSKQFLRDFDKVFKKRSKEMGYGKLDKNVQTTNVQVSKPAGFDKAIKFEKRQGIELSYQFDEGVIPGRPSRKYSLDDFKKDLKKFSGYKIQQNLPVIFTLTKGKFVYRVSYIGAISGVFVHGGTRV